jgi:hypothetical protein
MLLMQKESITKYLLGFVKYEKLIQAHFIKSLGMQAEHIAYLVIGEKGCFMLF